jgi:hypothetical protein
MQQQQQQQQACASAAGQLEMLLGDLRREAGLSEEQVGTAVCMCRCCDTIIMFEYYIFLAGVSSVLLLLLL